MCPRALLGHFYFRYLLHIQFSVSVKQAQELSCDQTGKVPWTWVEQEVSAEPPSCYPPAALPWFEGPTLQHRS
jgi:hypothetical protein